MPPAAKPCNKEHLRALFSTGLVPQRLQCLPSVCGGEAKGRAGAPAAEDGSPEECDCCCDNQRILQLLQDLLLTDVMERPV